MKSGDLVLWNGHDGKMRSGKVISVIDSGLVCAVMPATGGKTAWVASSQLRRITFTRIPLERR